MFWKKKIRLFNTVKFRITIWYAALFLASFLLVYVSLYNLLKSNMAKRRDNDLISLSEKMASLYFQGGEDDEEDRFLVDTVPENIVATAKKAVKGLNIRSNRYKKENGNDLYEISGYSGTQKYEIKVSLDGKVLEIEEQPLENSVAFIEEEFIDEARYEGINRLFLILYSSEGKLLTSSDLSVWKNLNIGHEIITSVGKTPSFITSPVPKDGGKVRIIMRRLFNGNVLVAGMNLSGDKIFLKTYSSLFLIIAITMLLLSSWVAWFIAGRSMSGVNRVSRIAASIGHDNLDQIIPYEDEGEEIRELVATFNEMLDRIHELVIELKEVSDNVAHDLRTPLTRIRGIVETSARDNNTIDGYRQMCGDIAEECDHLVETINTMLEITQMDSGTVKLDFTPVDIKEITTTAYQLFLPMAESSKINFRLNIHDGNLIVPGDRSRLQRLIANLVDNSLKYTESGGEVYLDVKRDEDYVELIVKDSGRGISQEEQAHIFDRFYRCDASRSLPGNGLGLSLAKAIVQAHKGTITVTNNSASGSIFTVSLPGQSIPN